MKRYLICLAAILGFSTPAFAGNVAHCEALIMQTFPSSDGKGETQIASYRPAVPFLSSLYDDEDGHLAELDGVPIRAIMCRRNDIIPTEFDYPILATGVPFILSQDFDSSDTDSLTIFWKDGALDYVYKGYPLSEGAQADLDRRLAEFSKRGKTIHPIEKTVENEAENIYDAPAISDTELGDVSGPIETESSPDLKNQKESSEESSE